MPVTEWHGAVLEGRVKTALGAAMTEIGLRAEGLAKGRLQKSEMYKKEQRLRYKTGPRAGRLRPAGGQWVKGGGRGLRTGTLRRSIHLATPGYNWDGDAVKPGPGTPERGGQQAQPADEGSRLTLELGSGLEYAAAVHERHYNPTVNQFIRKAVEEVAGQALQIVERHTRGLL